MTQLDKGLLIMRMEALRAIAQERDKHGAVAADVYVGGLLLGVVEYVKIHRGSRDAYNMFQGLADKIIEEELPR